MIVYAKRGEVDIGRHSMPDKERKKVTPAEGEHNAFESLMLHGVSVSLLLSLHLMTDDMF